MDFQKIVISNTEPDRKAKVWARPTKEGVDLLILDAGKWKPVMSEEVIREIMEDISTATEIIKGDTPSYSDMQYGKMYLDEENDAIFVPINEPGTSAYKVLEFTEDGLFLDKKNGSSNQRTKLSPRLTDLTPEERATLKGDKGDQGDSVIVGQGDLPLANTLGSSSEKAITQKCVTDELQYSTKLKEYSTVSQASIYVTDCPVTEGKTYKLVFTNVTSGAKFNLQTSNSIGTQIQPIFTGQVLSEGFATRFTAVADATHFRTYRHSGDCTITLYEVRNKFETIEEEIEGVESGIDAKIAEAQKISTELLSYSTASENRLITVACAIKKGKTYKFVFSDVTPGAVVTFSTANGDTPVEAILVDGSLSEGKVVLFTPSVNATHLRAYKKPSASASCTITVYEQRNIPNAIDEIEGQLGNMKRYTFTESTLPCNYQASLYATFNAALSASRQGSTVYGDYFFQAFRGSNFVYIGIWNLETKTSAGGVYLEDFAIENTHANCISFSSEKYDEGDLFPLLYVPSGYPDNTIGGSQVYVYRLVGAIGNLEAQLIQTITLNGFSWTEVICGDSGKLWITWVSVSTNNTIKFLCYNTPSIANATATINVTDTPVDEFVLPAQRFPNASGVDNLAQQAGCYNKGRIWMANGNPTGGSAGRLDGACVIVINVRSKCREAVIWLRDIDLMEGVTLAEVEGCFIWNNQLYFPTQAAQIQKINKIDLT